MVVFTDMAEKVHCSVSKVPFIHRSIVTNIIHVIGHDGWGLDMEFQENLLSERRDTAKKVLSSSHKLTFTMDRS
jgi:hypothetical protein